jgi:hypothetical protein
MRNKNPDLRPDAATALQQFENIIQTIPVEELNVQILHTWDPWTISQKNWLKTLRQPIVPKSIVPQPQNRSLRKRITRIFVSLEPDFLGMRSNFSQNILFS